MKCLIKYESLDGLTKIEPRHSYMPLGVNIIRPCMRRDSIIERTYEIWNIEYLDNEGETVCMYHYREI